MICIAPTSGVRTRAHLWIGRWGYKSRLKAVSHKLRLKAAERLAAMNRVLYGVPNSRLDRTSKGS